MRSRSYCHLPPDAHTHIRSGRIPDHRLTLIVREDAESIDGPVAHGGQLRMTRQHIDDLRDAAQLHQRRLVLSCTITHTEEFHRSNSHIHHHYNHYTQRKVPCVRRLHIPSSPTQVPAAASKCTVVEAEVPDGEAAPHSDFSDVGVLLEPGDDGPEAV